jgi:hypothetical protein
VRGKILTGQAARTSQETIEQLIEPSRRVFQESFNFEQTNLPRSKPSRALQSASRWKGSKRRVGAIMRCHFGFVWSKPKLAIPNRFSNTFWWHWKRSAKEDWRSCSSMNEMRAKCLAHPLLDFVPRATLVQLGPGPLHLIYITQLHISKVQIAKYESQISTNHK